MILDDRKRAIGKVIFVSADKFSIELMGKTDNFTVVGYDDVHYVANLGSFIMIPVKIDYVVAEIIGLREKEHTDNSSSVDGIKHFDKALSAKYLDVVPLGTLSRKTGEFSFGVSTFPSLYSDVLYALDEELDRIFNVNDYEELVDDFGNLIKNKILDKSKKHQTRYRALEIGTSTVFQGYQVKIGIDPFFGGHSAVLGNTGSGKSCTVATILQSLFEKPDEFKARGATFVLFDVNGEYSQALLGLTKSHGIGVKVFQLDGSDVDDTFKLPHWLLNNEEWELLLRASERTQIPVLRQALGLGGLVVNNDEKLKKVKQNLVARCIEECFRNGESPVSQIRRVLSLLDRFGTDELNRKILKDHNCNEKFGNFDPPGSQQAFLDAIKTFFSDDAAIPDYANAPFNFEGLEDCLEFSILYEEAHGNRQIRDYCSSLLTRFKHLSARADFGFLRHNEGEKTKNPEDFKRQFLNKLLGLTDTEEGLIKDNQIIIIDMNDVNDEIVELVASVISRMIFDLLRKTKQRNKLPVNLILEESHRYISERPSNHAINANKIFERIAKEGRKYGIFLTVASQRPSELSKTVLSQCSNYIIHRIQNPEDLSHIRQMTPFISDNILKRLPSLPKQHALIFGNSVTIPMTFKVRNVNPAPHSADAKIRELWFRPEEVPKTAAVATITTGAKK